MKFGPLVAARLAPLAAKRAILETVASVAFVASVASVASVAFVGCSSTNTSATIQPITGVTLRAEALTAGRGCGTNGGQLYKYAVLVYGYSPGTPDPLQSASYAVPVTGALYDCFTDGALVNLPVVNGQTTYRIDVYAYNQAAFVASSAAVTGAVAEAQATQPDGSPDATVRARATPHLDATAPSWTTQCRATQLQDVQALAVCPWGGAEPDPLRPGLQGIQGTAPTVASVEVPLATFASPNGIALSCDFDFTTVRYTYRVNNGAPTAATEVRCSSASDGGPNTPAPIEITPAVAPASYTFDVELFRSGTRVGATSCTATTSPGLKSTATCSTVTPTP